MNYDQVLIDSTPMLVASDAAIAGRIADGLMLVIQPEKNHRRLIMRTIDEIRLVGLKLTGIVVNRVTEDKSQSYYGGYGYGYGYGHSYKEADETSESVQAAA